MLKTKSKILRGNYVWLVLGICFQIFITFSIPWLNKILIDNILTDRQLIYIPRIVIGYLSFASINVCLYIVLPRTMMKIKEEISIELRVNVTDAIQKNEQNEFSSSNRGNLLTIFGKDINQISNFLSTGVHDLISQILSLATTMIVLTKIEWKFGIISILVIPIYLLIPFCFKKKLKQVNQDVQIKNAEINSLIQEILNGINQIRIFNKQNLFLGKMKKVSESYKEKQLKCITIQKFSSATLIIYWLVILLILWIGGQQALNGQVSIGVLLVTINYIDHIEWPVTRLTELYSDYHGYKISKERVQEILNENNQSSNKRPIDVIKINSLKFEQVTFRYPRAKNNVLNKVNFQINQGDRIGIIGKSGVGKSTLVKLIFGLYSPVGKLLVNNQDLSNVDLKKYRSRVAYLSQETYLFEMSLYENILLGVEKEVSFLDVINASKKAGSHEFISKLNRGYSTIYGKNGMNFSLGQKQRVALARIFLMNPDVIILDEPTSSLDNENTTYVLEQIMEKFGKDKIVLVITHHTINLKEFNKILHIEDGGVKIHKKD